MKITKFLLNTAIVGAMLFPSSAYAYNAGNIDEQCFAPKFKTFSPPEKTKDTPVPEVEPEAEIGFTVSGIADPTTIRAVAKDQPLDLTIVDKKSFYQVTAKLPAVLNGKYARIHLKAKAQKGECRTKDGWLIKVKKAGDVAEEAAPAE
ncbi:MAG: hypothetical protein GQ532_14830 [Methylomarinum sp.]|nr:hypothetical protein [Methylomarinum sp.]